MLFLPALFHRSASRHAGFPPDCGLAIAIAAGTVGIVHDGGDADGGTRAHQVKLVSESGMCDAVTSDDPPAKLMDSPMVATLPGHRSIDEDQAELHFGAGVTPLMRSNKPSCCATDTAD